MPGLAPVLDAFADTDRWGVLQLLLAPIEQFGDGPASILQLLARGPNDDTLAEIVAPARGWAQQATWLRQQG